MNLLNNKDLLRNLLQQGDVLNTINGGVVKTHVEEDQLDDCLQLGFWAPSIEPESFNVVLNHRTLVVFSVMSSEEEEMESSHFNVPLFFRKFKLPQQIDIEEIEATYFDGKLIVTLPFKGDFRPNKKINIHFDKE